MEAGVCVMRSRTSPLTDRSSCSQASPERPTLDELLSQDYCSNMLSEWRTGLAVGKEVSGEPQTLGLASALQAARIGAVSEDVVIPYAGLIEASREWAEASVRAEC